MKLLIVALVVLSSVSALARCNTDKAAVNYIKTNESYLGWIRAEPSNFKVANIPHLNNPEFGEHFNRVLVVADFKDATSTRTISNMIQVNIKSCKVDLIWTSNLRPFQD